MGVASTKLKYDDISLDAMMVNGDFIGYLRTPVIRKAGLSALFSAASGADARFVADSDLHYEQDVTRADVIEHVGGAIRMLSPHQNL